ncbi:hypothetical protein KVR01_010295 [Diaporthe batatas]|uniref:uncharacterized protein n=1 Tax=Diaporthe batatas TaxID=748121 RepID=UPI001D05AF7E|nr:uncharacterized protein KVR01_010295 [Diaporthe batatas]KAG8159658.1 hypothetical protein KVR01_010295 [Diaporthe batatas]
MLAKISTTLLYSLMGLLALAHALPSGPMETPPPSLEQRLAYYSERPPRQEVKQAQAQAQAPASPSSSSSSSSSPSPSPSPIVTAGTPSRLTITVVNKMPAAVSTSYVHNDGVPGLVAGGTGTGTLMPGASATLVAPEDWAGNVAVNLAEDPETGERWEMNGDVSLLEGSLMEWGGLGYRVDIDVSYVNGFSVPITCSCNKDKAVLSGCSLDLWELGTPCSGSSGAANGQGACANPLRPDDSDGLAATGFFAPCEGAAFTWPRDDANSEGMCGGGDGVTCCIGTAGDGCPVNPKQQGGGGGS